MANLIEVKKILKNQIYIESIRIEDIKSFRPWRKKENDTFDGEATFLVLQSGEEEDKKQLPTMLIQESYSNFLRRMGGKVIHK